MFVTDLLNKITHTYDYLVGRYHVSVAETEAEKQACLDIRRRIFGEELKRAKSDAPGPASVDDFDAHSLHIACRDRKSGEIIGTLRLTAAHHFLGHAEYEDEYSLRSFPKKLLPRIVIISRLAIKKEYRKSPASLMIFLKMEEFVLSRTDFVLAVIVCEPNLYPVYRKLGFRPLDRIRLSPFGGYRLPLFIVPHDYEALRRCGSPLAQVVDKLNLPARPEGLDWFRTTLENGRLIVPGFTLISEGKEKRFHSFLTEGLSDEGKEQLLKNAVSLQCRQNDTILKKGSGDKNLGFIKKGALEVRDGERVLVVLGEGDVFGEVAFILDVPRSADVVAALPDTEVVLLSLSAVERLKRAGDAARVWKNLARLLAQRLIAKNRVE